MNKRGISTIVSTLIIVLLCLVAVAVLWVTMKNVFSEQTGDISLDEFSLRLEMERVLLEEEDIVVSVERGSGGGELVGIMFIVSDGDSSESFERSTNLQELGKTTFTLTPSDLEMEEIISIDIYPIIENMKGERKEGNKLDSFDTTNLEVQECVPDCEGKECGDDGCDGSCGTCDEGSTCTENLCVIDECDPECDAIHSCTLGECELTTTNMVAWWRLDGNATDIVGGLDGIVSDALATEGKYNQAYSFDGDDDHISVNDDSAFDISGAVTIAFWIKPSSVSDNQRVLYRKNWVEVKINDEELEFKWIGGSSGDLKPKVDLDEDDEGEWIHVVSTISGDECVLYINGQEGDDDSEGDFDLNQPDQGLYFGAKSNLAKDYEGIIDEVMIFDVALSETEVELLYQADLS